MDSISGNDLDQLTREDLEAENFEWANPNKVSPSEFPLEEPSEEEEQAKEIRAEFVSGAAGTGKTYEIKRRIEADPSEGILCATTGIAGVNLGTRTIHSILKYFNTESLQQAYASGRLVRNLVELACNYRNLYCDEVSMLPALQLDTLVKAMQDANLSKKVKNSSNFNGIGLVLSGDFMQLPPIREKWAFEAECWPLFEANTLTLTKNWRQGDGNFLKAINHLRRGEGAAGANLLRNTGVEFANANKLDFPGTTILAKNVDVDRYNWVALSRVNGDTIEVESERWLYPGVNAPGEWKLIPEKLQVKLGALVMILANDSPFFSYANGDQGIIEAYDPTVKYFSIRLMRNGQLVNVPMIERRVTINYDPKAYNESGENTELIFSKKDKGLARPWREPYFDEEADKYVAGGIKYMPIRLGYAATVHKTQGLSLDRVQIDCRNGFFGQPAMMYVAVSRCRTPEGLRVVGSVDMLGKRCKIAKEVLRWL